MTAPTAAAAPAAVGAPIVNAIAPAQGTTVGGQPVSLRGRNLGGVESVRFGASAATDVQSQSTTRIRAVAPAGSGTVDVVVTTSHGASAPVPFTYVAPPATTATAVTSPLPATTRYDEPTGVSCPATGWCAALNTDGNGDLYLETLAQGVWTARLVYDGSSPSALLGAISCPAVRTCVAVGSTPTNQGPRGLIVTLAGGKVGVALIDAVQVNAFTSTSFSQVSCGSAAFCAATGSADGAPIVYQPGADGQWRRATLDSSVTAVGAVSCATDICAVLADTMSGPAVYLRHGDTWTRSALAAVPGGAAPTVSAVDCYRAGSCLAVGSYPVDSVATGLSERYTGGAWQARGVPRPPTAGAADDAGLTAVSCAGNGACVAIGASYAATLTPAGGSSVDLPAAGEGASFVSCGAAGSCAVGGSANSAQWLDILADGVWSPRAVPLPDAVAGKSAAMYGLSCAGVLFCVAQGAAFDVAPNGQRTDTLATITAAGPAFTPATAPAPGNAAAKAQVSLGGVSCWAGGSCVTVGTYVRATGGYGGELVTRTPAKTAVVRAPAPAGAGGDLIPSGVDCVGTGDCVAVGRYAATGAKTAGLILTRAGGSSGTWTAQPAPAPAGATYVELDDVACGQFCVAYGFASVAGDIVPLLIDNRGGTWRTQSVTLPAGITLDHLERVACPVTGTCAATGVATNGRALFLYSASSGNGWNGIYLAAPPGQDAATVRIAALSCSSDGNCVALGSYTASDRPYALVAENIDNGTLTAVDVPFPAAPGGWYDTTITALSCPADGNCVAVANSRANGPFLLRRANGAWGAQLAPLPGDSAPGSLPRLSAVSCVAAGQCVTVGYYQPTGGGRLRPMIGTLANGAWTVAALGLAPGLADPASETLGAVSCATGGCLAVGPWAHYGANGALDDSGSVLAYRRSS